MITEAFNYKKWADERTLRAIDCINKTSFSESYAFTLQQINHMVIVEELFKFRLTSGPIPHERTNTDTIPEFNELKSRLKESANWYANYVSTLDNKKSQDVISFTFADGKHGAMSVDEILFHIINHSSYHRGSIAHALDVAAVAHPIDGYGIYIHEKEPERREQT